jgi:hypothetical protein
LPPFIAGNEYCPDPSVYTVVVNVSLTPRADTPIPSRGLPSDDFTVPDNMPEEDADCEKVSRALKKKTNGKTVKTIRKTVILRGKIASLILINHR